MNSKNSCIRLLSSFHKLCWLQKKLLKARVSPTNFITIFSSTNVISMWRQIKQLLTYLFFQNIALGQYTLRQYIVCTLGGIHVNRSPRGYTYTDSLNNHFFPPKKNIVGYCPIEHHIYNMYSIVFHISKQPESRSEGNISYIALLYDILPSDVIPLLRGIYAVSDTDNKVQFDQYIIFRILSSKWNICNVYMGSRRAIYTDIVPTGRIFFVRGYKIPKGRPVAEGRRPDGTDLPEGILLPRTKKNRPGGGYIVVFSPTRPHIFNKYPSFFFSLTELHSYRNI